MNGVDMAGQNEAVTVDEPGTPREIAVEVAGTDPIAAVEVVKNNAAWRTIDGTDDPDADLDAYTASGEWTDNEPITGMSWDEDRGADGDVSVVRVRQANADRDPDMAWVGPIWAEAR